VINLKFQWQDTCVKMNETRLQQPRAMISCTSVTCFIVNAEMIFKNMGDSKFCSLQFARYFSRLLQEKFSLVLARCCSLSLSL